MKSFSIFQLQEALHLRATKWLDPMSYDDLSFFYDLRDQSRALNPQLVLIEPLSLAAWVVQKALVIFGLICTLWIFSALSAQGLKTWDIQAAADAFAVYAQGTGTSGMTSDLSNAMVIVLVVELLVVAVLPGWFFNWKNPVNKMVHMRLVEHSLHRMRSTQPPSHTSMLA